MQPHWRRHSFVLVALVLLTGAVVAFDLAFLGPSSGGWLDLRGLLIVPWLVLAVAFAGISSALVAWKKPDGFTAFVLYGGAAIGLVLLGVGAVSLYIFIEELGDEARMRAMHETATLLAEDLTLEGWAVEAGEARVDIRLAAPMDRVEVELDAKSGIGFGHESQRSVAAGAHTFQIPIEPDDESVESWSLRIRLERGDAIANVHYLEDPYPGEGWLVTRALPPPR